MAELIASGTTELASSDFILADGQTVSLNLKTTNTSRATAPGMAEASVQIKTADGGYIHVGSLTHHCPAQILSGPGTFRVVRKAGTSAFGVDKT